MLIIHFVNRVLQENVFMQQPLDFEQNKQQVCKLHKTLYNLKQVHRAWFEKLKSSLLQFGFTSSKANHSLFIQFTTNLVSLL